MSQTNPVPEDSHRDVASVAAEESLSQAIKAMGTVTGRLTPWLVEFGSWIFAGLIAFILVVLASLITVGPADRAIMVSAAAFALALPLTLAGLFLLRLVQDMKRVGLTDEWARAFRDVGFPVRGEVVSSPDREAQHTRRAQIVLLYCLGILTLSGLLTLTGLVAALWHIAWWIGVIFIAIAIISLGVVVAAFLTLRPTQSTEDQERERRYWAEMLRRAREQPKTNEGKE
jgi:hypothetical protein